jgi:hypothetical protein
MENKKITVELSSDLYKELCKEGSIGMTVEEVIRDMLEHVQTCDPYINRE